GLLASIRDHKPKDQPPIPITVLDVGLAPAQRDELGAQSIRLIEPGWQIEFPTRDKCPRWFQAYVARPFLPGLIPDADVIFSIDSDAWLHDWRAASLFLSTAAQGRLAIVPEIDRSYSTMYTKNHSVIENLASCYGKGWGEEVAARMVEMPPMNAG